ncbi:MAG: MBL fold metallo-hydrolase [Eubacterium sp.]|nr:MBL fold metallo-hydrolase [Eubacterium sp.]
MSIKTVPTEKIGDGIYLINEFDSTNCYLVVGSEKALLIDCGTGFCNLREAAEKLTDKPIILTATHGHVDHIGGAGQFEELYLHKADCGLFNKIQTAVPVRKLFVAFSGVIKENGFSKSDVKKGKYKTKIIPFDSNFVFDLGDRKVTVHHTPGHTKGSVALIDDREKFIFSGDNVCDALWMHLPGSTSLEEWLPSAEWLYQMSGEYRVFWGHRTPELSKEYIGKVISWGKEIISRQKRNSILPKIKQYPPQEDGILYKTNKVHRKEPLL